MEMVIGLLTSIGNYSSYGNDVGLGLSFFITILIYVFSFLISFLIAAAMNIPLFLLAKKCPRLSKKAWLALIPFGCVYIKMVLPESDINIKIGSIECHDRKKAFTTYILSFVAYMITYFIVIALCFIPFIGWIIGMLLGLVAFVAFMVVFYVIMYYTNYSFLDYYRPEEKNNVLFAILCLLTPIAFIVFAIMFCNDKYPTYEEYKQRKANAKA